LGSLVKAEKGRGANPEKSRRQVIGTKLGAAKNRRFDQNGQSLQGGVGRANLKETQNIKGFTELGGSPLQGLVWEV